MPPDIQQLPHQTLTVGQTFSINLTISGNPDLVVVTGLLEGHVYSYSNGIVNITGTTSTLFTNSTWVVTATNSMGMSQRSIIYHSFKAAPIIDISGIITQGFVIGSDISLSVPIMNQPSKVSVEGLLTGLSYSMSTEGVNIGGNIPLNSEFTVGSTSDQGMRIKASSLTSIGVETEDTAVVMYNLQNPEQSGVPSNILFTPVNNAITATWDPPTNTGGLEITGYRIRIDNGTWIDLDVSTRTYTFINLQPNTSYRIDLQAITILGNGSIYTADVLTTLPITVPSPPVNFRTTTIVRTVMTFEWDAPYDGNSVITDYLMRYKRKTEQSWSSYESVGNVTTHTYRYENFDSSRFDRIEIFEGHEFQIVAVNAIGNSAPSTMSPPDPASNVRYAQFHHATHTFRIEWDLPSDFGTGGELVHSRVHDDFYGGLGFRPARSATNVSYNNASRGIYDGMVGDTIISVYDHGVYLYNGFLYSDAAFFTILPSQVPPPSTQFIPEFDIIYEDPFSNINIYANQSISIQILAVGPPSPTFTATGLPSGVSINSSGLISGTITGSVGTIYNIVITATNIVGSADLSFTMTIIANVEGLFVVDFSRPINIFKYQYNVPNNQTVEPLTRFITTIDDGLITSIMCDNEHLYAYHLDSTIDTIYVFNKNSADFSSISPIRTFRLPSENFGAAALDENYIYIAERVGTSRYSINLYNKNTSNNSTASLVKRIYLDDFTFGRFVEGIDIVGDYIYIHNDVEQIVITPKITPNNDVAIPFKVINTPSSITGLATFSNFEVVGNDALFLDSQRNFHVSQNIHGVHDSELSIIRQFNVNINNRNIYAFSMDNQAPELSDPIFGDESVTLHWNPPTDYEDTITNYQYRINNGNWVSINSTETRYTITNLINGIGYSFRVRAVFSNSINSSSSNTVSATPSVLMYLGYESRSPFLYGPRIAVVNENANNNTAATISRYFYTPENNDRLQTIDVDDTNIYSYQAESNSDRIYVFDKNTQSGDGLNTIRRFSLNFGVQGGSTSVRVGGIAIDGDDLYVTNTRFPYAAIYIFNKNTSNNQTAARTRAFIVNTAVHYPRGIAIDGDDLYWLNTRTNPYTISVVNKNTANTEVATTTRSFTLPSDIGNMNSFVGGDMSIHGNNIYYNNQLNGNEGVYIFSKNTSNNTVASVIRTIDYPFDIFDSVGISVDG